MRFALLAGLLLALGALMLPAFAAPGAMRWSDAALKPYHAVASPDGTLICMERGFGKAAIYRTDTLTEVREIAADTAGYAFYVFSPDNALLAVGSRGRTRCYAVATGEMVGSCQGTARAFTAQGMLITTGNQRSIIFCDPRTGDTRRTLAAIGEVQQLALSPAGDVLAYMTNDALVLAKTTGEKLQQWPSSSITMRALAFSPDGSLLAGNTATDHLNVWRVADGTVVQEVALNRVVIGNACISADNRVLYYAAAGAEIYRITLADGKEGDPLPMTATPQMIALTANGTRLLATSQQRVAVWNPATNSTEMEMSVQDATGRPIAFSPDGTLLATCVKDGVALRKVADGALVRTLPCPGGVGEMLFSPDGARLAVTNDNRVLVLRVEDGGVQYTLQSPVRLWLRALAFSGDGKLLFVGGREMANGGQLGKIDVWRMTDGSLARTLDTGGEGLWSLAASANGNYIASGSQETRSVTIMNAFDGTKVRTLADQKGWLHSVAFTPDGDLLSAAPRELQVIDIKTGEVKRRIAERTPPFVLSADGATVISNGQYGNGPAFVWSLATGAVLATLRTDTQTGHFALTRDGQLAATSTTDGLAVWEVK